jgi:predicted nucleic acid-binding protein
MAAEPVSPLPLTRDPKDDYLLTYALAGQADYLVTGDADLLVLGQVGTVRIVSPADFAALLATDAEAD